MWKSWVWVWVWVWRHEWWLESIESGLSMKVSVWVWVTWRAVGVTVSQVRNPPIAGQYQSSWQATRRLIQSAQYEGTNSVIGLWDRIRIWGDLSITAYDVDQMRNSGILNLALDQRHSSNIILHARSKRGHKMPGQRPGQKRLFPHSLILIDIVLSFSPLPCLLFAESSSSTFWFGNLSAL